MKQLVRTLYEYKGGTWFKVNKRIMILLLFFAKTGDKVENNQGSERNKNLERKEQRTKQNVYRN